MTGTQNSSFFSHDGLRFAYTDQGEGPATLLIHGFASNGKVNWFDTGWVDLLLQQGRRVITFDHRGHGQSNKPHNVSAYEPPVMAYDALALLDHLNIQRADVMGYSMGARVTAFMLLLAPERLCSAVIAGIGAGLTEGTGDPAPIVEALEAPSLDDVTTQKGRMFRAFAEQTKSDLKALAACMRSSRKKILPEDLAKIRKPVLIAVGTRDAIAGSAQGLADLIPGAQVLDIVDRDHMRAVGDKQYKEGVVKFWNALPPCV
ncbi:MAG: alpha/beta hydrolase [Pseudomonadota bacterium]